MSAPAPNPLSPSQVQKNFNTAYYNSKDPLFDPFFNGRPGSRDPNGKELAGQERWSLANYIVAQGHLLDEEIDAEGMDPYSTMWQRQVVYGQNWEPPGKGQVESKEVISPGQYSGPAPAGTIKVSTDPADFPPFPISSGPPTPPIIPKTSNPIGPRVIQYGQSNSIGDFFRCAVANDGYGIGDTWTGTVGNFSGQWTKSALEAGLMTGWVKTA